MPEYSFKCNKCDRRFEKVWSISTYDDKMTKLKCPSCRTKKVRRDYEDYGLTVGYIKSLSEATTLGEYADKQTKLYGEEKVAQMHKDFVTKKRPGTGMKELPAGMTRMRDPADMPSLGKRGKKR